MSLIATMRSLMVSAWTGSLSLSDSYSENVSIHLSSSKSSLPWYCSSMVSTISTIVGYPISRTGADQQWSDEWCLREFRNVFCRSISADLLSPETRHVNPWSWAVEGRAGSILQKQVWRERGARSLPCAPGVSHAKRIEPGSQSGASHIGTSCWELCRLERDVFSIERDVLSCIQGS